MATVSRTTTSRILSIDCMPRPGRWFRYGTRFCVRERGSIDLVLDVTNTSLVPVYFGPKYCSDALRSQSDQSCHDLKSFGLDLGENCRASLSAIRVLYELLIVHGGFRSWHGCGSSSALAGLGWQPNTTLRFASRWEYPHPLLGSIGIAPSTVLGLEIRACVVFCGSGRWWCGRVELRDC
jgi:hypothetical protein